MPKRMYPVRADFDLRAKQIGEQVTRHFAGRASWKRETRRYRERICVGLVALQVHLQPEVLVDVNGDRTATAIQAMALGIGSVGAESRKGVIRAQFEARKLLSPSCQP